MKKRLFCLAGAFLFFALGGSSLFAGETRTWTDASGKFKIEAELLSYKNGQVELKREGGKTITLPASKLSGADREYLKSQEDNPFVTADESTPKTTPNNPPSGKTDSGSAPASDALPDAGPLGDFEMPAKTIDSNNALRLPPLRVGMTWKVPQETVTIPTTEPAPSILFALDSAFGRALGTYEPQFMIAPENGRALVLLKIGKLSSTQKFSIIAPLTASGNQPAGSVSPLPFCPTDADLSPNGSRLLGIRDPANEVNSGKEKSSCYLFDLTANGLSPSARFEIQLNESNDKCDNYVGSFPNLSRDAFSIPAVRWADNDHFFAARKSKIGTENSRLVLRDAATLRAIYSLDGVWGSLSMSPNRNYFAVGRLNGMVEIRQTKDGQGLGTFQAGDKPVVSTCFSPDGSLLAVRCGQEIQLYQVADGKRTEQIAGVVRSGALMMANNRSVLLDDTLYFFGKEMPICSYHTDGFHDQVFCSYQGKTWALLHADGGIGAACYELPHPTAIEKMSGADNDKILFGPGASVRLKLTLNNLLNEEEVRKILTRKLQERQVTVSDSARLELAVSLEESGTVTAEIGRKQGVMMTARDVEEEVELKNFACVARINDGETTRWHTLFLTTGEMIDLKTDNISEYRAALLAANKPTLKVIEQITIPEKIRELDLSRPLCHANLKLTGIQDY